MPKDVGKVLLGACLGAALMWLSHFAFWSGVAGSPPARKEIGRVAAAAPAAKAEPSGPAADLQADIRPTSSRQSQGPTSPANEAGAPETPSHELDMTAGAGEPSPSSRTAPLNALLNSIRIRCDFGPGGGGNWLKGTSQIHSASWQGGEIVFESVDLEADKAQMTGTQGATGSSEGATDVRVVATGTGLHFSGFTPRGELVVTSVFGAVDGSGRYLAVMSRHGTQFDHESAQFYGNCDIGLSK
jgi:hypothetical protein